MTPEEIKVGHTYQCIGNPDCLVLSVGDDSVTYRDCYGVAESDLAGFASLCVRDITPAPESDQGEKVAQAQSQGPSRMNDMDVLPCPFCGDDGIIAGSIDLYCSTCGASGPSGAGTEAEDIARWNRRTPPAADAVKGDLLYCLTRIIDELPTQRDWLDPSLESQARVAIARAESGTPSHPRFRHKRTGDIYELLLIANEHAERTAQYPPTAVYRRVSDRTVWSRPVQDWGKDFEEMTGNE